MRNKFADAVYEIGSKDNRICALVADISPAGSMLKFRENYPERFSPNVLMRPLYQEVILPNISYIGGGGEMAYWMQLKNFFKSMKKKGVP